jgi:uncharacterized protein YjbI with pentapeptide repeats
MANSEHVEVLKQGVERWNLWRVENPGIIPDFVSADLSGLSLKGVNLIEANLINANFSNADLSESFLSWAFLNEADMRGADLSDAKLKGAQLKDANLSNAKLNLADLSEANLKKADLNGADLSSSVLTETDLENATLDRANLKGAYLLMADLNDATLRHADLSGANLSGADFSGADLSDADLRDANLSKTIFVETNLEGANLRGCRIYGIAAWNIALSKTTDQRQLIIGKEGDTEITVDNLEVAQFIYLLLNNSKIRDVIDTVTSKAVLILGRFAPEQKKILDALREELRRRGYLPILFDFEKPSSKDLTETIATLAHMARFIIADLTNAKSVPQELSVIVPQLPSVPVQPIINVADKEYAMFEHWRRYPWVLPLYSYQSEQDLLESLISMVINPAELKAAELKPPAS